MKIIVKNKIILIIAAVILFFCTVFSAFPFFSQSSKVYAANSEIKFDDTNVLDDLKSSTINGKPFNIYNYPFDSTGKAKHPEIINFVEYCYSFKVNMQGNYGLYLYFYNPQALNIDVNSLSNKVQLAVSYNADETPNNYDKFSLKFISKSEESSYKNLFYKFKIIDRKGADGKTILQRVNSNERRYDISGIELATVGATNATDYTVGGTYKFKNYVKGYGADDKAESNLTVAVNELETVSLDVQRTNYRTDSSSKGEYYQNDLNSVYFSVPNDLLKKYKKLQKIKAEWNEYKTTPIIATKHRDVYDNMQGSLGKKITSDTGYDFNFPYGFLGGEHSLGSGSAYEWGYNGYWETSYGSGDVLIDNESNFISYMFCSYETALKDFTVTSNELLKYINDYPKTGETIEVNGRKFSKDLFMDNVDSNRQRGYNVKEFDADDSFDLLSYDSTHSGWQKFWDYFGNWGFDTAGTVSNISPIYEVKDNDVIGDNSVIANRLLIDVNDVNAFKDYVTAAKGKKIPETTFLFRFAATDYYTMFVETRGNKNSGTKTYSVDDGYMAQLTAFLDFDILQLTFNRDGDYIVIPVVSSPIDIIGSVIPPAISDSGCNDIVKLIVMVIALLILFIIISPLLPLIIRFVVWVISLPLRLIGGIVNLFKKKEKKGATRSDKKK